LAFAIYRYRVYKRRESELWDSLAFAPHSSKILVSGISRLVERLGFRMYLSSIAAAASKYKMDRSLSNVAARILSDNELVICAYSPTG
jgi:predicted ABC-type sugar transport system permease subunit